MARTTFLAPDRLHHVRSSQGLVATVALVMGCGAAACVVGIAYSNAHDMLGYDFDQTPVAYLLYMFMLIGALCAPLGGGLALAMYALQRRKAHRGIVQSDVVAFAALVVLLVTGWALLA